MVHCEASQLRKSILTIIWICRYRYYNAWPFYWEPVFQGWQKARPDLLLPFLPQSSIREKHNFMPVPLSLIIHCVLLPFTKRFKSAKIPSKINTKPSIFLYPALLQMRCEIPNKIKNTLKKALIITTKTFLFFLLKFFLLKFKLL